MTATRRIHLAYADRIDAFVVPLAARLRERAAVDPLAGHTLVIPGRAWEAWLKRALADHMPVVAGIRFQLLESWLDGLARTSADQRVRTLGAAELGHLVRGCLSDPALMSEPAMAPVADWIAAGTSPSRRVVRLSSELGRLYQEYALSRPQPIRVWSEGRMWDEAAAQRPDVEAWQRRLWQAVLARRDQLARGREQVWWLPHETLEQAWQGDALPETVDIVGLSTAAEAVIDVFARLAERGVDVRVWALNPCREYWDDVEAGRLVPATTPDVDDPWGLGAPDENALLRLWGRPGRQFIRRLNLSVDFDFDDRFGAAPEPRTVLEHVRADVIERRATPSVADLKADGSLNFVSCAGERRELEAVAERIAGLVTDGAARYADVAVVLPDGKTDAWLSLVPAVFRRIGEIPWRSVGGRLEAGSAWLRLARSVLALPGQPIDRAGVLALVTHPCARAGIDPARRAVWDERLAALGVTLGADADDLRGTAVDPDLLHWDQGLSRIALATFTGGSDAAARAAADDTAEASRLARAVRALLADARAAQQGEHPLAVWHRLATAMIERHLAPRDGDDATPRLRAIEALGRAAEADVDGSPMPWDAAASLFDEALASLSEVALRGHPGGVSVGPLSALRGLPFRHTFVVGVMEGQLPRGDRRSSFDLRESPRQYGDVPPPERDRYALLQVLMATSDSLTLSWQGRDPKTGDAVEPSAAALELLHVARALVAPDERAALVSVQAVQPYDRSIIESPGRASTFDPRTAEAAGARRLRHDLRAAASDFALPDDPAVLAGLVHPDVAAELERLARTPWDGAVAPVPQRVDVRERWLSLHALRRWLEHPMQAAARYGLQMATADREGDAPFAAEPLAVSRMEHGSMWTRVLARMRRGDALDHALDAELAVMRRGGRAPSGVLVDDHRRIERDGLAVLLDNATERGLSSPHDWSFRAIGRVGEDVDIDDVAPLDLPGIGPGGATVRLHGELPLIDPVTGTIILVSNSDKPLKADAAARRFARAVAPAAACVALGWLEEPVHVVELSCVVGKDDQRSRTLVFGGAEAARHWLARQAAGVLAPPPPWRFPLDVVSAWIGARGTPKEKTFAECLVAADASSRQRSWQVGPLDDDERYPGPPEELVPDLVRERLAPLFPDSPLVAGEPT